MVSAINAAHFVQAPSSELSDTMAAPASFKLLYFPIMGLASTSRDIFNFAGAEYKSTYPDNWTVDKPNTPFGGLPVLFITGKNGKEVIISETSVIENYLSKLYGLLGDNLYEETLIKSFSSSSNALQNLFITAVTWNDPSGAAVMLGFFKNVSLPTACASWERHLVDNGSNGHFVGNKLSLADIRISNMLEHFACQPAAEEILAIIQQYPNLYKMRQSVASNPKLAEWRKSEEWTATFAKTKAFFENPRAFLK
ncbi:hypothetical protein BGZ94_002492 [Podila epigama]|nr:hypothetical protein BGZ94_002492 [Podila epigama]